MKKLVPIGVVVLTALLLSGCFIEKQIWLNGPFDVKVEIDEESGSFSIRPNRDLKMFYYTLDGSEPNLGSHRRTDISAGSSGSEPGFTTFSGTLKYVAESVEGETFTGEGAFQADTMIIGMEKKEIRGMVPGKKIIIDDGYSQYNYAYFESSLKIYPGVPGTIHVKKIESSTGNYATGFKDLRKALGSAAWSVKTNEPVTVYAESEDSVGDYKIEIWMEI